MKFRKEKKIFFNGNVKLRILQLKDNGLDLESWGPGHRATMGHATMNLLRDKLYIVSQAVEEAVSPPSGVPVAVNGICLYLTWQTAFSGSAPAV